MISRILCLQPSHSSSHFILSNSWRLCNLVLDLGLYLMSVREMRTAYGELPLRVTCVDIGWSREQGAGAPGHSWHSWHLWHRSATRSPWAMRWRLNMAGHGWTWLDSPKWRVRVPMRHASTRKLEDRERGTQRLTEIEAIAKCFWKPNIPLPGWNINSGSTW